MSQSSVSSFNDLTWPANFPKDLLGRDFTPETSTDDGSNDLDRGRRLSTPALPPRSRTVSLDSIEQTNMLPDPLLDYGHQLEIKFEDFRQGQASVVDYFRRGEAIMKSLLGPNGVVDKDEEIKLVSAFIGGLDDDYDQQVLRSYVKEHGFAWKNVERSYVHNLKRMAEQHEKGENLAVKDRAMSNRPSSCGPDVKHQTANKKHQLALDELENGQAVPKKRQRARYQADASVELRRTTRVADKRGKAGK